MSNKLEKLVVSTDHGKFDVWFQDGEGDPLVLIPGAGSGQEIFDNLRKQKALTMPIVSFDFVLVPGMFVGLPSMSFLADMLCELFDKLGYKQVDLLGVSLSGPLAMTFALRHPGRVRKLALVATTADKRSLFTLFAMLIYTFGLRGGDYDKKKSIRQDFKDKVSRALYLPDVYRKWALLFWRDGHKVNEIVCPTLIVSGTEDLLVTPEMMEGLKDIPEHTFIKEKWGHMLAWTRAKSLATELAEFLKS